MFKLTLKDLWTRKRRLTGSFIAVFLGVAFMSGTMMLTDTMRSGIEGSLADAYDGTGVVVRNSTDVSDQPDNRTGSIDRSIASQVAGMDDVAVAQPVIDGTGQALAEDGTVVGGMGQRRAGTWITDPDSNPYQLIKGHAPGAADEVVITERIADDGNLGVGDQTTVLTPEPLKVKIAGIATFGPSGGIGGQSYIGFTDETASQYLAGSAERISRVVVKADEGISSDALAERIDDALPSGVEAITGENLADESFSAVQDDYLTMLRAAGVVFSGIALLVAALTIHNTFSITVAQRVRQSALLRLIGADRRMLLRSVGLEALLIGLVGAVIGALGGLGIATLLRGALASMGLDPPVGGTVVNAGTVALSMAVGILVTLLACVGPTMRASRVSPLAALRETARDDAQASRTRVTAGLALAVIGIALLAIGAAGQVVPVAGLGAVLCVAAMAALGPTVARPAGAVLGAVAARLRGVSGLLAKQNVVRSPRRIAGAATALMVGVGVVTLLTVLAGSWQADAEARVRDDFSGDLAVQAPGFGGGAGLNPQAAEEIAGLPEIENAVGIGQGSAQVDGSNETIQFAEPEQLDGLVTLETTAGSLAGLGEDHLAISTDAAEDNGWRVGDQVTVTYADGADQQFAIVAIYEPNDLLGSYLMSRTAWQAHHSQITDAIVFAGLADGVSSEDGTAAVPQAVEAYGAPEVQDRQEFINDQISSISTMLSVVYVMLALAIVIALLGIANTMSLSVYERTRELGLLRAVGAHRGQARSMVRWESLITAVFGTAGGLGLGIVLGWGLVLATAGEEIGGTFNLPVGQLMVIALVGTVAGLLASLRPARRAVQLNTLDAIAVT